VESRIYSSLGEGERPLAAPAKLAKDLVAVARSGGHRREKEEIKMPLEDFSAHYLGMLCLAMLGVNR
jgi:hypothetical protein